MRLFSYILALLLLACSLLAGDIIVQYSDKTVRVDSTISNMSVDSILNELTDLGYFDYSILKNSNMITITTGERCLLHDLISVDKLLQPIINCNCEFDRETIDQLLDSLLQSYKEKGHYFATIMIADLKINQSMADIYYHLVPGPIVRISNIELNGLVKADRSKILELLDIKPGDTLSETILKTGVNNLSRIDYLTLINGPVINALPGYEEAVVGFELKERTELTIEGNIGYAPQDNDRVLWYLHFKGDNLFGGGQNAELSVDQNVTDISRLSVYYSQPVNLFKFDRAEISIRTRDYKDRFYEFGFSSGYKVTLGNILKFGVGLGWKNVEPNSGSERSYNLSSAKIEARWHDFRAQRGEASFGMNWSFEYLHRNYKADPNDSIGLSKSFDDSRNRLNIQSMLPLFKFVSVYNRLALNDIQSDDRPLPLSDQFFFGGLGSVRGYENDQFNAQRYLLANLELRLFYEKLDYLYTFLDLAYYENYRLENTSQIEKYDDIISGYGLGTALHTSTLGLIIELGWGEGNRVDEPIFNLSLFSRF